MMNGLYVQQNGQQYAVYTPQDIQIGLLFMGQDGQHMNKSGLSPLWAADRTA